MSAATANLSAQENAIHEGKKVLHGTVTDRVLRMFERTRAYGPPRVALERSVLFTEAFKENENDPLILKWAKALKRYAEKSTVAILDDELIVGRPNTWLGRWAIVYAELDGAIMPAGVEMCLPGDNVRLAVTLSRPVALAAGDRFAVREGGKTVGSGMVARVVA